ncbi:MAG: hypothetical protein Q4E05_07545 [Pseudoclavibacter sp.]|nr:hypothetical protein [Pseudoclavibacter sp.]
MSAAGPGGGGLPEPPSVPPVPPRNGTTAWALGFLCLLPVPFINMVLAGAAMTIAGLPLRGDENPVARGNGRGAANLGLTMLASSALCVLAFLFAGLAEDTALDSLGALVWIVSLCQWLLYGTWFLVLAIFGTIRSNAGRVFRPRPVVPFLRERRAEAGGAGVPRTVQRTPPPSR